MEEKDKENQADQIPKEETISDNDKVILEMAKMRLKLGVANLEKAAAQNETNEHFIKCLLLQLYLKYKLDPESDFLNENDGTIMRGALKKEDK
jgi:hypothetical protein